MARTEIYALHNTQHASMKHLILIGDWSERGAALAGLLASGYSLTTASGANDLAPDLLAKRPCLLLAALSDAACLDRATLVAQQLSLPWLAWDMAHSGSPNGSLTAAAYRAGALAVLPSHLPPESMQQAVENLWQQMPQPLTYPHSIGENGRRGRPYQPGETIPLADDAVLTVQRGIIAQTVIFSDGKEVLLGLHGAGQLLLGHPEDDCCLHLAAHTEAEVSLTTWHEACRTPQLARHLRDRMRQMEAWSAMQARPYLDQRVMGILSLLAEQFGRPHPEGMLVDVRLTHAQLATAVGATRATVTRCLGDLRTRNLLCVVGRGGGEGERFCIRQWQPQAHRHYHKQF